MPSIIFRYNASYLALVRSSSILAMTLLVDSLDAPMISRLVAEICLPAFKCSDKLLLVTILCDHPEIIADYLCFALNHGPDGLFQGGTVSCMYFIEDGITQDVFFC